MSAQTAVSPAWTDAAAHGTRLERALLALGTGLTRMAARSAQRRAQRHARPAHTFTGDPAEFADHQRERVLTEAALRGLLRR